MNRCPSCGDSLRFVGIRAIGTLWERWAVSPICRLFIVTAPAGNVLGVTSEEPKKGYFNGESAR